MSKGIALILLLAGAGRLAGQTETQVRRRIALLEQALARNTATLARADSGRRSSVPLDTLRAGALTVITTRATAPMVRQVIDHAWRILDQTYGSAATVLSRYPLPVQIVGRTGEILPMRPSPGSGLRGVTLNAILPTGADSGTVLRALLFQSSLALGAMRDSALTAWLHVNFTPPWPRDDRLELTYIDLVTSPWSHARTCYLGDLTACRRALGLSGREAPILEWYDAPDRRRLVRDRPYSSFDRTAGVQYQRCLNGGPDTACVAAIHASRFFTLDTPLQAPARLSLLQAALTTGGRGAYERLLAGAGRPLDERLAFAAGIPTDSLLSRWRAAVLAARPKTVAFATRQAWAAVIWGVLFGFLAMRSTRWR